MIAGLTNDPGRQEEIFGPVLTVIAHDGDDDAVRSPTTRRAGCPGTVFSADPQRAQAIANRLRVGTVTVNGGVWYSADVPFGGYKQSGVGRRWVWWGSRSIWNSRSSRRRCNPFAEWQGRSVRRGNGTVRRQGGHRHRFGWGIGQAYAEALAREGAAVAVADINTEGAERVARGIAAEGGRAIAVPVDVSDPDSAATMADRTIAEFGGIDFLVNNAAIFGGMKLDMLLTVDWDYYKRFMSVNLDGALVCTRAVYRAWPPGEAAPSSTSPRPPPGCTPTTTVSPRSASTA